MRTDPDTRWMGMFFDATNKASDAQRRQDEMVLELLAGEPITLFGRRVEITFTWPDGLPMGHTDEAAFRAEMVEWLARHRAHNERMRQIRAGRA